MDDDEEILQRYGTPLEPLDEDEVPAKKPIAIEDQIVTDENGKRRFHGAFTGGFSAGFWNTVGSLEGWKPSDFKSSRKEKAPQRILQKPEDFMDDEDLGEFGIAPQRIQAQTDFQIESTNSSRKRKLMQSQATSGPIPGVPVLAELLRPVEDKIAVRILKSMGWKPGQGIGPRLTSKQKKRTRERNKREEYVLRRYGCVEEDGKSDNDDVAGMQKGSCDEDDDGSDDNEDDDELTFAPDDYDSLVCTAKTNRFGLGYTGLSHDTSSGSKQTHFNLFGPLEVVDKNNKKLSIHGQAFGVGALEEEDEDIYAHDDLTKYDFCLEERKLKPKSAPKHKQNRHIIEGFDAAKQDAQYQTPFVIEPPAGFQPRNWAMRKSRFAPLSAEKRQEIESAVGHKKVGLGRHDLNPAQRSAILEEKSVAIAAQESVEKRSVEELQAAQQRRNERTKSLLERIAKTDNFALGGIINTKGEEEVVKTDTEMMKVQQAVQKEQQSLLAKAGSKTKGLGATARDNSAFKPFLNNENKQQRYEKFLAANLTNEIEIATFLATIQPVDLSEWDREMERKEFMQARKIYQPLRGVMSDRFVSEAALTTEKTSTDAKRTESKAEETKKTIMERTKEMWKPHSLLCKRYNIEEPFGGTTPDYNPKQSHATKSGIFDYLETSVNRKDNFQTPIIIPKHIEKPKAVVSNRSREPSKSSEQSKIVPTKATPPIETPPLPTITAPLVVPSTLKPFKVPPKTELEKRVEESRDKPASEKVELFRAIFENSDDDDKDDSNAKNKQMVSMPTTGKTALEVEKLGLPSLCKPPSVASMNDLTKLGPPRGIFSAVFTAKSDEKQEIKTSKQQSSNETPYKTELIENKDKTNTMEAPPQKITFKPRSKRQQEENQEVQENDHSYGPALPANISTYQKSAGNARSKSALDSKLLTLFEKHKSTKIVKDVWVERSTKDDNGAGDDDDSSSHSESGSSSNNGSDSTSKIRKKKSKKLKKSTDKAREKKKVKKLKKKAKTKKKSKKKKNK